MRPRASMLLFLALAGGLAAGYQSMGNVLARSLSTGVLPENPPSPPGSPPAQSVEAAPPPLTFVTYNVGMARGAVALADERLPLLIATLGKLEADVMCLNEVWTDADAKAITEALSSSFPYAFRERTTDESEPTTPCGVWKTWRLSQCVTKSCSSKGISTEECVSTGPCGERYRAIPDDCKRCLAANTASPTSCALGGAQEYAWEGRNGLLLLSRQPIESASYVGHDAVLVKRGMITADIAGYHTICTHLSADLGVVPYPPGREFKSWEDEQEAEIDAMLETWPRDQCTVLMGDLNTGSAVANLAAELPDNAARFAAAGFLEPWDSMKCTWCRENPLTGSMTDKWIDHIFFRGCPSTLAVSYQRMFDQEISVAVEGKTLPTRLSDHFGLMARVTY